MTASLTILFLVLMFLGMPVAFAIGISFMLFYLLGPAPAMISVQKIVVSTQNFPLLAIPLFIFAGHLMNHSGITERLIKLSTVMTGWISGGLAHVAIMLSALMGGVSGSAVADAAMEARVLGPSMVKSGLSKGYACASMTVGSLITALVEMLGDPRLGQGRRHLVRRRLHQRTVERGRHVQRDRPSAQFLGLLDGQIHRRLVARNHDVAGVVVIGDHADTRR